MVDLAKLSSSDSYGWSTGEGDYEQRSMAGRTRGVRVSSEGGRKGVIRVRKDRTN